MVESMDLGQHSGTTDRSVRIRRAVPTDAHSIAAISVISWQRAYRGILPDAFLDRLNVEAREEAWRTALESNPGREAPVWIAERGTDAVGFVSSGPTRDEDLVAGTVEVYAIYVLPNDWRAGIGAALLRTAIADARNRGSPLVALWVLEENERARRFYEAIGGRPDGARQLFELRDASAPEVRYLFDPTEPNAAVAAGQPADPVPG